MDRINLHELRAYGRHGADPGEREREQPFDIAIALELDLRAAQQSDNLVDTIDYSAICSTVRERVAHTSYALLERLAGDLLDALFDDARIARAEVTIAKPRILGGATPSVTLVRENPRHACR